MIPTFDDALRCAAYWVAKVHPEMSETEVRAKARELAEAEVEVSRGGGTLPDYAQAMLRIQDWGFDHLDDHTPFFYH